MGEGAVTLPEREETAVKGDHGRVLVVGGSRRYSNTPAIVSLGALRAGTDLVTVAAPERSADTTASYALNIISEPLDGGMLQEEHVDTVMELAAQSDCLAIGPGLGRDEETREAVRTILRSHTGEAVVDADAIRAAADEPDVLAGTVITPHANEFAALAGGHPGEATDERTGAAQALADELDCTVLLKGAEDVVADTDRVETVAAGNPYMTRGGTGDVLTGVTAGLVAQGLAPFRAAVTAARVNGEAGDRALDEHGTGFLLEEMLDHVSGVLDGGRR